MSFFSFFSVRRDFVFVFFVFFLRLHTACCKYEVIYLSTSNEGPNVGASGAHDDVSPLSNGRLCAGAHENIPRTFAQSVWGY